MNVATTSVDCVSVTVQAPVPEHAPPHPANVPVVADALSVIGCPASTFVPPFGQKR